MINGWKIIPLAEACSVFTDGDWIETKDQSPDGIRLIQTGNVGIGVFKNREAKARHISNSTFERLNCTEIYEGDCLLSRLPDPVGRSCILPETGERMITAVDCTILRFRDDVLLARFFNYYSQCGEFLREVDQYCTGATRRRISRKNLGKVEVPLPPLGEQKRIVAILDEAFAAIDAVTANTEKNLANAREVFESYLNSVFTNEDETWEMKALGSVCENLDSTRVPITKSDRKPGSIPYYGASGVVDHVEGFIFDEDLLLVSEDGANLLARTYPIAFSINGKMWVNNHAHVLRFKKMSSQRFVEYYINSISIASYVSGMAQPKLNQKSLNSIQVPFPLDEVQETVVNKCDMLQQESQELESLYTRKLALLAELKQSILQKAFSGELTAGCLDAAAINELEDAIA